MAPSQEQHMQRRNKDSFWVWTSVVGVLVIGAGIAVYTLRREPPAVEPEPAAEVAPAAGREEVRAPRVAGSEAPVDRSIPLPPLDESDTEVQGGLTEMFGSEAVARHLVPERIIRNMVVTIDNLPREKLAIQQRPVKPTPGQFLTAGEDESLAIAPENFDRYAPVVALVRDVDAKTLVAWYRGLQPLFQKAYEELGHPNAFFNTRLLEVIEHLLETPDPEGPIALKRPSVLYVYEDESLEALSAGQKLLLRMGPENRAAIKRKLREIQAELI
jgi:hypothetical protein